MLARMANALNRHEALAPRAFTAAVMRRDAFGPRRAFRVLVAEVEDRVVGYASFVTGYNTDIAARELWMHDLFVVPAWRSRGVGRALVTAVAREAVRRGYRCLEWGVRGTNRRAIRFYHRLGARLGHARIASLRGRSLFALAASG
jgi:GNAT superfamily N-acetyltransferase